MVIVVNKRPPDGRHGGLGIKGNGKLANNYLVRKAKGIDILTITCYAVVEVHQEVSVDAFETLLQYRGRAFIFAGK